MSIIEVLLIAMALAADAFTVGAVVGLVHRKPRQRFRLSFHFGLFQALMPLLGAFFGKLLGDFAHEWSHWIAFALLIFVGGKMCIEALRGEREERLGDLTRGFSLVILSLAVSIDALVVGFTLGLRGVEILFIVSVIGIVAALFTLVGMIVASQIGPLIGKRAEIAAGIVLMGLGTKILITALI